MRQNKRSKIEPLETPAVSLSYEEPCLFKTTLCFWLSKRYYRTLRKLPDVLFWSRLDMTPLRQTLSKKSFNLRTLIKSFKIS